MYYLLYTSHACLSIYILGWSDNNLALPQNIELEESFKK